MDNTDIFIITKKKYMNMVEEHLRQSSRDIDKEKVIDIFGYSKLLVDTI